MSRHALRCTDVAHERLVKSGLAKKLAVRELEDVLFGPAAEKLEAHFHDALSAGLLDHSARSRAALQQEAFHAEFPDSVRHDWMLDDRVAARLVRGYSAFVAELLLDEKVRSNPEKYGFPDRSTLESAATAYAVTSPLENLLKNDGRAWYAHGRHNRIGNNPDGDLVIEQADAGAQLRRERTLFGERENFRAFNEDPTRFAKCHNDWTPLLVAALRYAQAIGKTGIPEIARWRETYRPDGHRVMPTTEAYGDDMEAEHAKWALGHLPELTGKPGRSFGLHDFGSFHAPVLRDGNLVFLAFAEKGDDRVEMPEGSSGTGDVTFGPDDLPQIMRACFGHFGRNPAMLPAVLAAFDAQRAG